MPQTLVLIYAKRNPLEKLASELGDVIKVDELDETEFGSYEIVLEDHPEFDPVVERLGKIITSSAVSVQNELVPADIPELVYRINRFKRIIAPSSYSFQVSEEVTSEMVDTLFGEGTSKSLKRNPKSFDHVPDPGQYL